MSSAGSRIMQDIVNSLKSRRGDSRESTFSIFFAKAKENCFKASEWQSDEFLDECGAETMRASLASLRLSTLGTLFCLSLEVPGCLFE